MCAWHGRVPMSLTAWAPVWLGAHRPVPGPATKIDNTESHEVGKVRSDTGADPQP